MENVLSFQNSKAQNYLVTLRHTKMEMHVRQTISLWWRCVCLTKCIQWRSVSYSLQHGHHTKILHKWPGIATKVIPGHNQVGGTYHPTRVVPEASSPVHPTTIDGIHVVVHIIRRKFHSIVRIKDKRMNISEQVVNGTDITTHNIAGDVLNTYQCQNLSV